MQIVIFYLKYHIFVAFFFFAWTPYLIMAIYAVFIGPVPPLAGTIPAMFAKSSLLSSSLIYIYTNKTIRTKITRKLFNAKPKEISISIGKIN